VPFLFKEAGKLSKQPAQASLMRQTTHSASGFYFYGGKKEVLTTMSKSGVLQYKCRRCGKISENLHVPSVSMAVSCIVSNIPIPKAWGSIQIGMYDMHYCEDGGIGVCDLIGGIVD